MTDIVDYLRKRLIVMLVTTLHYGGRMKKYWINIGSILEYLDQLDQLEYLNQYWINIGILLLESGSEAIGRSSL